MKQNDNLNPKDEALNEFIEATAEQVNPNPIFQSELEKRLINAHKPKTGFTLPSLKQSAPMLGWAVVIALLVFGFNWMLRALNPGQMPASNDNSCAVTQPNGSLPPGETVESSDYLGNGQLWTVLWPNGKIIMSPENQRTDGSFDMKWGWWRGVTGPLTVEGHRLDAEAEPLRADIPDGYGDTGFQVSALIFPSTGCWEVTGRVGDSSLTFVTEVLFGNATPTPNAVIDSNSTPVADNGGYLFRGGKLYPTQPLPESPAEAHVYLLNKDQSATADKARALADRFGIQGEIYAAPDLIYKYTITDGKQWFSIGSSSYFFYTSDMVKNNRGLSGTPNDNAESIIREFLTTRGFDFPFSIAPSDLYGGYIVQPLAPDGLPMQYEFFSPPVMRAVLDENGEVLSLDANLMSIDQTPVGTYGIIPAEEALNVLLDDSIIAGKIESMHSGVGVPPQQWYRQYADGEQVTIYGTLTITPAINSSRPALLVIDGVMALGNTDGLDALENHAFIKATGKYVSENGIRKFMVESWDSKSIELVYLTGVLRRDGDQIILASDDGQNEYPLVDPPTDVPLETKITESQLSVSGVITDGKMDWTNIQYFADASHMGGGGGGGGMGFYQLNLSGTPVPFPTPTQVPTPFADSNSLQYVVQEGDTLNRIASIYGLTPEQLMQANGIAEPTIFIGQVLAIPGTSAPPQLDGTRGMLNVNVFSNGDGTQRTEYGFITNDPQNPYVLLEGDNLQELQEYNNKPVEIWGVADHINEYGTPVARVERYEIPFPDLQPQILKGTEKAVELDGKNAVLFTAEDGAVYVEFMPGCNDMIPMESMSGTKGPDADKGNGSILVEALAVPDLSFAGYPGVCVFSSAPAIQPNGEPMQLTISSDQPNVMPEPPTMALQSPNLVIDKVELSYYVSNPNYQVNDPTASERSPYIQPVWHFHGQYESGEEFDAIIQALKKEFLLPELATYIQGG